MVPPAHAGGTDLIAQVTDLIAQVTDLITQVETTISQDPADRRPVHLLRSRSPAPGYARSIDAAGCLCRPRGCVILASFHPVASSLSRMP